MRWFSNNNISYLVSTVIFSLKKIFYGIRFSDGSLSFTEYNDSGPPTDSEANG